MADRHIAVPVSGNAPALLILPQPLTPDAVGRLERGLAGMLCELRRELDEGAVERGRLEYESWIGQLRSAQA